MGATRVTPRAPRTERAAVERGVDLFLMLGGEPWPVPVIDAPPCPWWLTTLAVVLPIALVACAALLTG